MNVAQLVEWELAEETEVLEEALPYTTLSTTSSTWSDPGLRPEHRDEKPVTNRLSYDTAHRKVLALSGGEWMEVAQDNVQWQALCLSLLWATLRCCQQLDNMASNIRMVSE
jgi:hypothetical protein